MNAPQSGQKISVAELHKYPNVPTRKTPPKIFKEWRIYTDVNSSRWRCLKMGARVDQAFSWKQDGRKAWADLIKHVKTK